MFHNKSLIQILVFVSMLFYGCAAKQNDPLFANSVANQPGILNFTNTANYLGSVPIGNTLESKISVRASGGLDLFGMSAAVSGDPFYTFKGGSYPGVGGTCGTKLISGTTCDVVLIYEPTSITTNHLSLTFTYSDTISTKSVSKTFESDSHPIITFEYGTQYNFGNKFVGTSTDLSIILTNTGRTAANSISIANLTAPFSFKGGSYPGTGGTCAGNLQIGQSCKIIINYSPTNNGQHLQDITLQYTNNGVPEQNVLNLTAWGFYPAVLSLSDSGTYDFGTQVAGKDYDKTYTITYISGDVFATSINLSDLASPFKFKGGSYPGTGGTCGPTLRSGSCTIVLSMSTSASGNWQNNFSVSYHDGITSNIFNRTIKGVTKQKPVLTISPTTTYDFGMIHTASTASKVYTVTYASGELAALNIGIAGLAAPFNYLGGTFPGTGGTCSTSLSSGSCTIVLAYSPTTQLNLWQTTVNFGYDDYFDRVLQSLTLKGTTESKMDFEATSVNFGNKLIGTQATSYARIYFSGGSPATSLTPSAPGVPFAYTGGTYPGTSGNCSTSHSSGYCSIYFIYTPTDSNTHNQTYTLTYFDGFDTKTITTNLTGKGIDPAFLTIPATDFGSASVNSVTHKTITITNSTTVTATSISAQTLPSGFTFKNGSYPGQGGTCSTSLGAGGSCTIVITFNPLIVGNFSGTLALNYYNGVANTSNSGSLSATAINTNELFISSADTYYYGSKFIGTNTDYTFTLYHGGSASGATLISGAALPVDYSFAGGSFPGTGGTCGTTLSSGNSCTFVVRFSPLTIGTKNASVTINYNNGVINTSVTRLVSGVGLAAAFLTIPNTDFGETSVNSLTTKSISISNSTTMSATSVSPAALPSGFSFKGGSYPGQGGTCWTTISAGATCTIVVTFNPLSAGNYSNTLTMNYFNGSISSSSSADLTASAINTNDLFFTSSDLYSFGSKYVGTNTDYTFTIRHGGDPSGATLISGSALPVDYSFAGGTFPGTGGTCGATLASGNSCTFVVRFSPQSSGTKNTNVTINYNNGSINTSVSRAVSGVGLPAAVLSIPDTDLGTLSVNSITHRTITITNSTTVNATSVSAQALPSGYTFKGGTYPGSGGTCSTSISAGASCNVVITFSPLLAGNYTGNLTMNYFNGNITTNNSGELTAIAANTNDLFISGTDGYSFGSRFIGTNTDYTFTLYHGGASSGATSITGAALPADYTFAGGTFPGTGGTCGSSLSSGNTCTFVVRFSPLSAGVKNANVTINYNNGTINTSVTRQVTGTGRQQSVITIAPNPHDFGTQIIGSTYQQTFTLTTSGPETATSRTASFTGAGFSFKGGSYPGTGGTCSSGHSASCTIVVLFSPVLETGYSSTLKIRYFDSNAWVDATADLSGTGKGSAILSFTHASPYNFGKVIQTSFGEAILTLNNSGTVNATALSASTLSAPFSYKGGSYPGTGGTCGTSLLASGSCTMVVRFSPTTTGVRNSSIVVNYHNGTANTQSTTDLTGEGVAQAVLSISEANPYNFGSVVVGSSLIKVFTLTNGGETQATGIGGTFSSPSFQFKGGAFPGAGGSCSTSLNAYSSCTIVLNFSPPSLGLIPGLFTLNYNDGLGPQTELKNLLGTGIASFKVTGLLQMIPIKKIDLIEPELFFEEAMDANGDKIELSNGSTISGRNELIYKKGRFKKVFKFSNENMDASSLFSSWGLSKFNIGDINDDFVDDFIVSHFSPDSLPGPDETIFFTCYSGRDLAVIYNITIPHTSKLLVGLSSAVIPEDIDGDGHNDFITGLYQKVENRLILKDFTIFSAKSGEQIPYSE